eukprot:4140410-Prymnesium_polylepis.1
MDRCSHYRSAPAVLFIHLVRSVAVLRACGPWSRGRRRARGASGRQWCGVFVAATMSGWATGLAQSVAPS